MQHFITTYSKFHLPLYCPLSIKSFCSSVFATHKWKQINVHKNKVCRICFRHDLPFVLWVQHSQTGSAVVPAGEQAWEEQSHFSLAVLLKVNSTPNLVCFVDGRRALNQLLLFDATIPPTLPLWTGCCGLGPHLTGLNQQRGLGFFQINAKLRRNKLNKPANTIYRTTKWMKQIVSSKPWVSILPAGEVENRSGNISSISISCDLLWKFIPSQRY